MSTESASLNAPSDKVASPRPEKDKGKIKGSKPVDEEMGSDDDDDDDDDDDEEEEEDSSEIEEEIDPDIKPEDILPRRTRGKKVDYTSPEALQKAGLDPESHHEEDEEEFHDDAMKE